MPPASKSPTPKRSQAEGVYNGLASKVQFARRMYRESLERPEVRRFAENATGAGTRTAQTKALFDTLRQTTPYMRDPVGVEMTKAPWVVVEEIKARGVSPGDCDDKATTAYVMAKLIGIPAMLRVGWYGKKDPQHIYVMVKLEGRWVPFDTTLSRLGAENAAVRVRDFA